MEVEDDFERANEVDKLSLQHLDRVWKAEEVNAARLAAKAPWTLGMFAAVSTLSVVIAEAISRLDILPRLAGVIFLILIFTLVMVGVRVAIGLPGVQIGAPKNWLSWTVSWLIGWGWIYKLITHEVLAPAPGRTFACEYLLPNPMVAISTRSEKALLRFHMQYLSQGIRELRTQSAVRSRRLDTANRIAYFTFTLVAASLLVLIASGVKRSSTNLSAEVSERAGGDAAPKRSTNGGGAF